MRSRFPTRLLACLGTSCFLLAAGLVHAEEGKAAAYRDPKNRFFLQAPVGWKVRPLGESVQVVRGDSYVSVLIFDRVSDATRLVDELSQQMGKKWRRFEPGQRGDAMLSGRKAAASLFSGVNAQGAEAVLKLVGVVSGGTGYVLVVGSPKSDLPKVQDTLAQIERSFTLLDAASGASAPAEPTLGVEVTDLSSDDAPAYELKDPAGALVVHVAEQGPAQAAGVQLHDLIVTAGGQAIADAAALQQVVQSHEPGDALELEVRRVGADGKTVERKTLKATLGSTVPARGPSAN